MRGEYGTDNGSFSGSWGRLRTLNTADTINGAWVLQGGKQFKTAIFVLAAINLAAAVTMIGNILYDAWTVREWDFETKRQKNFGWLWHIHPAEMFPLIVSGAVVLQSIVVLPVQGLNTDPLLFDGCAKIVQLVWPAIWIAPITMLVFGVETTFRSLRRTRFPNRNRWHIPTSLASIVALTIFLWAASNAFPTSGACVTGLIWWTARYFKLAIVICSGMLFLFITSTVIITVQLVKTVKIDRAERIAATRVVYYLVANTWIILLILPYYILIATNTRAQMTAQIAEIALNLTGLLNFIMHIFLRSNADRLAIRSAETPWSDTRSMRVFGPSDLNIQKHISYPLLRQVGDHDNHPFIAEKLEKRSSISSVQSDHRSYSTQGPLQLAVFPSPKEKRLHTPPTKMPLRRSLTRNNSVYSLFPTSFSAQPLHMSTSTTFSDIDEYEMPLPPPPLFAPKHDRTDSEESRQSSATVRIGLRLSYMNHALDLLDDSPPSNMQPSLQSIYAAPTRQKLKRASASSDAVNDYAALLEQTYKDAGVQRWKSISSKGQQVSHIAAQISIPQQESSALRTETLSSATFQRPANQSPFPTTSTGPQIAVNTRDNQQRAVDSATYTTGLPRTPKAAPSWRPQNWSMAKPGSSPNVSPIERVKGDERSGRKGSGTTDKDLPMVPESAQLDVSPLSTNNPWYVSKPQVQTPPGWI